jgi:transposase
MIRSQNHKLDLRIHLVRFALEHGIRGAAQHFQCSRNTVRLWLRRYQHHGVAGLSEKSRRPHTSPHKTPPQVEQQVIQQRLKTPGFGARRLKREFELSPSAGAIARIIRQNALARPRKKKRQVKRDLRAVKALYPPLARLQMDVKYLNDIPHYWPYFSSGAFPRFQYTVRCPKTGAVFLTYGEELSLTYADLTVRRLLSHLKAFGIDPAEVSIQTDRGSEFDGQAITKTDRGFTATVEGDFGAHHRLLKGGHPNGNADVESFHAHEETEFFDIESFASTADFWAKITTYQDYWNLARPNSYKANQTPLEILRDCAPQISPRALLLPPVNLDTLLPSHLGQDVPVLTENCVMVQ